MEYQDGRYVITFNGEIYNFIEIRDTLKKKGYIFYSDTDTEVILAAYLEWKENCLQYFNGMWAFAIWDRQEKNLFIARDRFGIKPLFYTMLDKEGGIAFASEMKTLIPVLSDVTINYNLMDYSQVFRYEATEECLIQEIKRFPAGYYANIKNGSFCKVRWWHTLDHLPDIPHKYEDQVDLFCELFKDACKIRMRSDVTVGTALSGGLDSSATICTMAHIAKLKQSERVSRDWQHAFVAVFPGTVMDESYYAKKVTDFLGIKSTFIDIDPKAFSNRLEECLYTFEEIYSTSPIPMMVTYEEIKKAGVSVSIDGHGADELFCGYSFDFLTAFPDAKCNKKRIEEVMKAYADAFPHDNSNMAFKGKEKDYKKYLRYILEYTVKNLQRRLEIYDTPDWKHPVWKEMDYMNKVLYLHTHQDILPTLLRNYDRYSMAGGVEIRMPFMDYRIVSLAFALPGSSKLRNGFSKAIVRDALAPYMPNEIIKRKTKIGFNTPIVEWMQGEMKEYFGDMIASVDFANSNVIDSKQVKQEILAVINGGDSVTYLQAETAYKMLAPYLWEKCFYKRVCRELRG